MASYYIFKRDNNTGKTTPICNGIHDTQKECLNHFLAYMYGFMDAAIEMVGANNYGMVSDYKDENRPSFRFTVPSQNKNVEYFMLFDQAGHDMIMETCK